MQKIKVIELFAGYGSQRLALKRLNRDYPEFDFEVVAFCEIDKYAIKAYNALHGDHIPNLGDITKVNPYDVPDCDLMTWSFPCTDISSAGQQKGLTEGSDTRSSLCWDAMRIFEAKRPKYLLMENVSALVSQKFLGDFNKLQSDLQNLGYTNFFKLINAKDMGVPQNRLRIFMVSVLDCQRAYYFPKPFKLEKRLKDVLEQNVDERYYLSEKTIQRLLRFNKESPKIVEPTIYGLPHGHFKGALYTDYAPTVKSSAYAANNQLIEPCIAAMRGRDKDNPNDRGKSSDNYAQRLELKTDGTSNTLTSVAKDNLLIEPTIIENFYGTVREPRIYTDEAPTLRADRTGLMTIENADGDNDMVIGSMQKHAYVGPIDGVTPCVNAACGMGGGQRAMVTEHNIRIRYLTERELFRLMDVDEPDIDTLLSAGIAKTQLAKLAGNSVVCACYYHIFRNLFVDTEPAAGTQTTLF